MNTHIHIAFFFFSYNNNMSLQNVRTEHLSPSNKGHSYLQRQLSRFWWHRGDFLAKSSLLQLKALLRHSHHAVALRPCSPIDQTPAGGAEECSTTEENLK